MQQKNSLSGGCHIIERFFHPVSTILLIALNACKKHPIAGYLIYEYIGQIRSNLKKVVLVVVVVVVVVVLVLVVVAAVAVAVAGIVVGCCSAVAVRRTLCTK